MGGGTGGAETFWGWGIGIIILGLVLAYAAIRAGRLRPAERARLDQNTRDTFAAQDRMERNGPAGSDVPVRSSMPYGVIIPIALVAFAIVLMIWSFAGDRVPRQDAQTTSQQTTGTAVPKQSEPSAPAPAMPRNDAGSDSARGTQAPLNKTH
ncbi:conserved hypothetical protein [Bradyrhizobium sp. STM 3843]|uniref:hypothetical protein n=1 Tax=Bradyrhizobium sp. STM 3843 TaxID=551947 RepID=UPI000240B0D8|nr:hypothetical protein [Bradyrhizobium sp. STM 3843]CCE07542.1 conserved hypothetical protein [Bradyrhizobium sp. STM 3843]